MIEWYDKLYTDEKTTKNLDQYMDTLQRGNVKFPALYCVTLASNRENLFDLISCNELWFDHYRRNRLFVIGLAASYKSALELLQTMVMDMYKQTGELKPYKYFVNEE